ITTSPIGTLYVSAALNGSLADEILARRKKLQFIRERQNHNPLYPRGTRFSQLLICFSLSSTEGHGVPWMACCLLLLDIVNPYSYIAGECQRRFLRAKLPRSCASITLRWHAWSRRASSPCQKSLRPAT